MSSIGLANPLPPASMSRPAIWRFCAGTAIILSLVGCVSQSTYESATSEADNLRMELNRVRMEIGTLEEQKEGLHKLALKGETVLAGIRSELQRARESYAEHNAKLNQLSALQDKARTLSQQRNAYSQDIKTAKKNAIKLQADIKRYEREVGLIPDGVESLQVSQTFEVDSSTPKIVATVSPLSSMPSPTSLNPTPNLPPSGSTPSAILPVGTSKASPQLPEVSTVPPPSQPSKPISGPAVSTAAAPHQQQPADESWIASLSGWFSSIWDWLFS